MQQVSGKGCFFLFAPLSVLVKVFGSVRLKPRRIFFLSVPVGRRLRFFMIKLESKETGTKEPKRAGRGNENLTERPYASGSVTGSHSHGYKHMRMCRCTELPLCTPPRPHAVVPVHRACLCT